MKKKKLDSLSTKFKKQKIAQLTDFKGKSIDYACARGVVGGDGGGHWNTRKSICYHCDPNHTENCTIA